MSQRLTPYVFTVPPNSAAPKFRTLLQPTRVCAKEEDTREKALMKAWVEQCREQTAAAVVVVAPRRRRLRVPRSRRYRTNGAKNMHSRVFSASDYCLTSAEQRPRWDSSACV